MKTTSLIPHACWMAVVLGAFWVGKRLSAEGEREPDAGTTGAVSESAPVDSKLSRREFQPPTSPAAFADEMEDVLAESDEQLRINRANRLINGLTPEVLEGLTPGMVPGLLQLFEDVKGSAGVTRGTIDAHGALIAAWARLDPQAAARHAVDRSTQYYPWKIFPSSMSYHMGDVRDATRQAAIAEWAKVDLAGAKEFVAGVEYQYAREDVELGLVKHLTATDLDEAIAWSVELEAARTGGAERFEMSELVSQIQEQRGIDGVGKWLDTVPYTPTEDGSLGYHEGAVAALGQSMLDAMKAELKAAKEARKQAAASPDTTESDLAALDEAIAEMNSVTGWPEEYVDFLKQNADEPFLTAEVLTENHWGPSYSLEVILGLPPEIGARREAVGNEFQELVNQNFEHAGKWLREQERGPVHDEAIQVYVREATQGDLTTAMAWAREITDPGLRAETIAYVRERSGR